MHEYRVAAGSSPRDLERAVKKLMGKGWVPCAGLSAAGGSGFFQGMTRTERNARKEERRERKAAAAEKKWLLGTDEKSAGADRRNVTAEEREYDK